MIYGESSVGMRLPEELLQAIEEGRSITPEELVALRERIYWDTGAYLALNGGVAQLVEQYASALDTSSDDSYVQRVYETVAFMLICAERYQLHQKNQLS